MKYVHPAGVHVSFLYIIMNNQILLFLLIINYLMFPLLLLNIIDCL